MYTDFLESAPIRKPCPNGPEGATRLYVEVTCPQCNKVFVDIPSESLRTCKASRCKWHLDRVHTNHTNGNPPNTGHKKLSTLCFLRLSSPNWPAPNIQTLRARSYLPRSR